MDWKRIAWVMLAELIVLLLLFDLYLCCRYEKGVIHWILDKCRFSSKGKHFNCEECNTRLVTERGTKKPFDFAKEFERWPRPVISYPDLLSSTRDLGTRLPVLPVPPPHPSPLLCVRQFIFAGCNSYEILPFLSRSAKSSLFRWQNDKHINIWKLVSSTTTFYLKRVEQWRLLACFPAKMTLIRRAHY